MDNEKSEIFQRLLNESERKIPTFAVSTFQDVIDALNELTS